jgi:hypothetical protein
MKFATLAAITAVVACGSTGAKVDGGAGGSRGDGAVGVCRANTPVGASVSWAEDGAAKCAVSVIAQRSTVGENQVLQLQGATLDGDSVAFIVTAYAGVLEGTHACSIGTPDGALLGTPGTVYVDFVHTGTKQACSVTITNGGVVDVANATGTFSATFTGPLGAAVTNGIFDTPVKGPPA